MFNQIVNLQTALNFFGFGLAVDGIAGPMTQDALGVLHRNIPVLSSLPRDPGKKTEQPEYTARLCAGRASTFGGANDPGDRCEHQAYLPLPAGRTPEQYYAVVPDWVRDLLNPEMQNHAVWPTVRDWKGQVRPAGVSYFLNPQKFYCALRLYGKLAAAGKSGNPVRVRVYNRARRNLSIECIVTDWGPTEFLDGRRWRFDVDLSPGAYRALELSDTRGESGFYGDHVWVEVLNAELYGK